MSVAYNNAFSKSVQALVESAKDPSSEVRDHINGALLSMAQKNFGSVLNVICQFLTNNKVGNTPTHQRVTLLRSIRRISQEYDDQVSDKLMLELVTVCYADMTHTIDINSEWQQAACQTAAELCCINPGACVPYLINQIPGTTLPHYFIVSALSQAADSRPIRFIPYMKECLSKFMPILGMAKQDIIRCVTANALASFAEAIFQLYALPELSPRSQPAAKAKADDYYDGMYTALSLLVNDWSGTKELRARNAVCMAMGKLSCVVHAERLSERLPQLVKLLCTAVRKEKPSDVRDTLKGMTFLIQAGMDKLPTQLEIHLPELFGAVFHQIVVYNGLGTTQQTELLKNHQELMLSVEAMALGSTQTVLSFIQAQLDVKFGSKDVTTRCAALGIIRHLVQRQHLDACLAPLKNNVVAVVRTCLEDTDYRMQKTVVQTIMSMGAAVTNNFLACDGADVLVQYVVVHSAHGPHTIHEWKLKNKKLDDAGQPGPGDLRHLATSVLSLFNTTLPNLDTVMWPFVLEMIGLMPTKPDIYYTFPTITNIICSVSKRLGNTHDFYFDFDRVVNVPKPEALIATFCVMMSQPQHLGVEVTMQIVKAMECISPLLDEPMKRGSDGSTPIGSLWLGTLPEIRNYLTSEEFKQDDYEEACHNLLKKTAQARKEEIWVQAIATQFGNQLGMWTPSNIPADFVKERHDFKRVALSMFGLAVSRTNLKTFVTDNLNLLAEATDHNNEAQRMGTSRALGAIATVHTDVVLDKVGKIAKPPRSGGGGGGFFGSKKPEAGPDKDFGELSRATALLGYGNIAKKANQGLFTSRFETHVVPMFLEMVQTAKQPAVKIAALNCQNMLGTSLRKCPDFNFVSKASVMNACIQQMLVEPTQYAMNDATAYQLLYCGYTALIPTAHLKPLCDDELLKSLRQCIAAGICKEWVEQTPPLSDSAMQKQVGLLGCSMLESAKDIQQALIAQGGHLSRFLSSRNHVRRERSVKAYVVLLKHFGKQCSERGTEVPKVMKGPAELGGGAQPAVPAECNTAEEQPQKNKKPDKKPDKKQDKNKGKEEPAEKPEPKQLSFGTIIGCLLPRLADEKLKTRNDALDGFSFCVKLLLMVNGESAGFTKALQIVKGLHGRLDYKDESDLVVIMKEVTAALCSFLVSQKELAMVIEELIVRGLVDPVEEASVAVCAILSGLFKGLGGVQIGSEPSLSDEEVKLFLHKLIVALGVLDSMGTRKDTHRGTLLAIKALAKNRPSLVFNELLMYPVPHSEDLTQVVQTLASDTGLSKLITNHCLDVLLNAQLFQEGYKSGTPNLHICAPVIAACCTIGEVCGTVKGADVARSLQAPLLCSILLLMAASHEGPRIQVSDEQTKRGWLPSSQVPPVSLCKVALQAFVTVTSSDDLPDRFTDGFWNLFCDDRAFPYAVACLILALVHDQHAEGQKDTSIKLGEEPVTVLPATTACPIVQDLYDFIVVYVQKIYDAHRRCALCILGQLLYHCKESQPLLQGIINALLSRAGVDEQFVIKLQATQGFTHMPVHGYDAIKLYVAPVIGSLISCCADPALEVCIAAMGTLENLIVRINCKQELSAVVVNICLRTKSALDSPDARIRGAGCSLFGCLSRLAVEGTVDYSVMEPNVHSHLCSVLVHVNDEDQTVRHASKQALHDIAGYLSHAAPSKKAAEHIARLFDKEHMHPKKETNYDEFANEFSKIWVRHYGPRVNDLLAGHVGYFQSPWAVIRAAAAIFAGTVLRHLSDSDQARSNLESSVAGLIQLMKKDPNENTRTKAAKALGYLGDMQ